MTGSEAILLAIAIIGCIIGVIGFFNSNQNDTKEEAMWRGTVNGKLDAVLGLSIRVDKMEETIQRHDTDISKLKDSSKRAHERIDIIVGERK